MAAAQVAATLAAAGSILIGCALTETERYDPLARARQRTRVDNLEAVVPPQCYTVTRGVSNPCWTCHTSSQSPNHLDDWALQVEYSFSDFAMTNRWTNLFVDRSRQVATITDEAALAYIRADNYRALVDALRLIGDYPGYVPDLDFDRGFDDVGFARDGSGWRAVRYKPFNGTFWPTNGSAGDLFIRLPRRFRQSADGEPSREVYRLNLAILEAAIATPPARPPDHLGRRIEAVDERTGAIDLDRDGRLGIASVVEQLPDHYAGGASEIVTQRYLYPTGTEFLHTIRYVDPDAPTLLSRRMKEVRYMRKVRHVDDWARLRAYEVELEHKGEGVLPQFGGSALVGLLNEFGWQLQAFIEDASGRLRLQTREEHTYCMGCHGSIGITVDQTFGFARKVPGRDGWRPQDLRGIRDVPQAGHDRPEIARWFERVGAGDEFRSNREILGRFFPGGELDAAAVARAAPGGDRDITYLVTPSRQRAVALAKAYMVLVREQSFELGRDVILGPIENVHREIEDPATGLEAVLDGSLWLDW